MVLLPYFFSQETQMFLLNFILIICILIMTCYGFVLGLDRLAAVVLKAMDHLFWSHVHCDCLMTAPHLLSGLFSDGC